MAKFINTRKAVSEIEDLIKNAGEKLTLVSPYLPVLRLEIQLDNRNGKVADMTIFACIGVFLQEQCKGRGGYGKRMDSGHNML